jgi:mycothiol synthase
VVLHLRHGGSTSVHVIAEEPGTLELLGYAHLDVADAAEGPAAELAVSPGARRCGVGSTLLDEVAQVAEGYPGPLRLWAHGNAAAAHELAATRGFDQVRRLWQLRRSLFAPLEDLALPEGVSVRSIDPEADLPAVIEVNRRAFTHLPDQGSWTEVDFRRRMAEAWFDPAGFLIAVDPDERIVGFHWTKTHEHPPAADGQQPGHSHEPLGEVYVVAVDPSAQGIGLGRGLTLAGLHHLRHRGLSAALLYVDAENEAALRLYRSLGFSSWDSDTLFRR